MIGFIHSANVGIPKEWSQQLDVFTWIVIEFDDIVCGTKKETDKKYRIESNIDLENATNNIKQNDMENKIEGIQCLEYHNTITEYINLGMKEEREQKINIKIYSDITDDGGWELEDCKGKIRIYNNNEIQKIYGQEIVLELVCFFNFEAIDEISNIISEYNDVTETRKNRENSFGDESYICIFDLEDDMIESKEYIEYDNDV